MSLMFESPQFHRLGFRNTRPIYAHELELCWLLSEPIISLNYHSRHYLRLDRQLPMYLYTDAFITFAWISVVKLRS